MCSESSAKISGFGLSDWNRNGDNLDLTRWSSPETMMNRLSGVKGDMWSLGCVYWEVFSLGATPYSGVKIRDLMTRVTRGLRLPHPVSVSDQLYQLMLTCWMLDPDERPGPGEAYDHLREMAQLASQHISFVFPPSGDFVYEQFDPSLELTSSNTNTASNTSQLDGSYV